MNTIKLDYNNMFKNIIGEHGITEDDINNIKGKIEDAKKAMVTKRAAGKMDWRDLPHNQNEIVDEILTYVNDVKGKFEAFVVLGIGGSALGPMAVMQAINNPYYNELSLEERNGFPKFYVADNVDPEKLFYLFKTVDPTKCLFNVISKSGSTSETMSQFMIIKQLLEDKLGIEEAKKHMLCTTDKENGNLIKIAKEEGYKYFIIPSGVGGRFSELCPVGLIPAAMAGIDIKKLLSGAAYMDELCKNDDIYKNPAYMFAILNYLALEQGKNMVVMMPYADSLKYISDWFAQLWAESLGKKYDNQGNVVNVGPTPIKALGVTDQHSQVQLYTEGPFDKIVVILGVENYKTTITIPKIYQDVKSLGFLGGVTQNQLIQVEQMATEYALVVSGKQNMTLTVSEVNEHTIGQILYLFEVATAFAGELMNINAFDQPGVEEGKNATYAMFGRPGYEDKKKEIEQRPAKNQKYIM